MDESHRQLCWAHIKRDLTAISERTRVSQDKLTAAVALLNSPREKTPLAKTLRTCQQLLKWEAALWTFALHPGIEPTNNAAEQALHPAVIWRRLSFGSQSEAGSQFVSRMLTVIATLKIQGRDVLEFLTQACKAARFGEPISPHKAPPLEWLPFKASSQADPSKICSDC